MSQDSGKAFQIRRKKVKEERKRKKKSLLDDPERPGMTTLSTLSGIVWV